MPINSGDIHRKQFVNSFDTITDVGIYARLYFVTTHFI